jgi:membrane protein YdbS with pleckstrin-like domain
MRDEHLRCEVEHHLDGVTIRLHPGTRPAVRMLLGALLGLAVVVGLGLLADATFTMSWPANIASTWVLAFLLVAVLLAGRGLVRRWRGTLREHLTHTITIRGGQLTRHSALGVSRTPLSDIVAFDAERCVLVTRRYRAIRLAAGERPVVRAALSALIEEHIDHTPDGSTDDVPRALRQLQVQKIL